VQIARRVDFETLRVRTGGAVLFADISAPPRVQMRIAAREVQTVRHSLILKRRDVGVVDRARLEIDSARTC
jgi:hypothetical protein